MVDCGLKYRGLLNRPCPQSKNKSSKQLTLNGARPSEFAWQFPHGAQLVTPVLVKNGPPLWGRSAECSAPAAMQRAMREKGTSAYPADSTLEVNERQMSQQHRSVVRKTWIKSSEQKASLHQAHRFSP